MAYSTIDKSTTNFNTKLYTGTGTSHNITGVGFQPDWVWVKNRDINTDAPTIYDAVRGATKRLQTSSSGAESTKTNGLIAFGSDGYTAGSASAINANGSNLVSWNWLAGGASPAITYAVKVVSDSGNKYRFDDFGTSAVTLDLQEGGTYTFDQSDSSNSGHPLRFSTTSNGSHGGGSEYTTGVTTNGTPGSSGAYTRITVAASAPTLYYYCTNHSAMGGQANTNSTFGSSNFKGDVQSLVSANTDAGFSIVKVSNLNSNSFGHGLNGTPDLVISKRTDNTANWRVYYTGITSGNSLFLNTTAGSSSEGSRIGSTDATTVTAVGSANGGNAGTGTSINYCFQSITGYSKFGSYTGNGNADGTFVYTGFKPAFVMVKIAVGNTGGWDMLDNKRDTFNPTDQILQANSNAAEADSDDIDFLSNGFKIRNTSGNHNGNGNTFIYMAFGQTIVGSNNVPATAR